MPPDDSRLSVILGDAAEVAAQRVAMPVRVKGVAEL